MTIHSHPVCDCLDCPFLDAGDGPEMHCVKHATYIPNPEIKPDFCKVVHIDVTEDEGKPSAGETLLDTGLLFEINRKVLHPVGMALAVVEHDDGRVELSQELVQVEDLEGMLFTPEAYQDGAAKYSVFMITIGYKLLDARSKGCGLHVQSYPGHGFDRPDASISENEKNEKEQTQPSINENQSGEAGAHPNPCDDESVAGAHRK